jgi:hypothetical protein
MNRDLIKIESDGYVLEEIIPNSNIGFRLSSFISLNIPNTAIRKTMMIIILYMELVLVITFIPLFAMNSDVKLITMIIINNGVLVRYWDMTKLPRLNR